MCNILGLSANLSACSVEIARFSTAQSRVHQHTATLAPKGCAQPGARKARNLESMARIEEGYGSIYGSQWEFNVIQMGFNEMSKRSDGDLMVT